MSQNTENVDSIDVRKRDVIESVSRILYREVKDSNPSQERIISFDLSDDMIPKDPNSEIVSQILCATMVALDKIDDIKVYGAFINGCAEITYDIDHIDHQDVKDCFVHVGDFYDNMSEDMLNQIDKYAKNFGGD